MVSLFFYIFYFFIFIVLVYFINSFLFAKSISTFISLRISFYLLLLLALSMLLLLNIFFMIFTDTTSILIKTIFTQDIMTVFLPYFFIFILVTLITVVYSMSFLFFELCQFLIFITFIFLAGFGLFFTNSFIFFFIFYELLLIPSFLILYHFSKTRKCLEASYLMFFWTQFGAVFLIFIFINIFFISGFSTFDNLFFFNFSVFQSNLFIFLFFIGFGVKFPVWPFYDWLPKAHVEASTNFSIFLSGVLVKFAFFGFFKCFLIFNYSTNLLPIFLLLSVGLFDAGLKIYYQIDLKKLIAYATVVEMHWLTWALITGQSVMLIVVFIMLISHALLSSNFFLIVDSITRRFKTRLITEISGIYLLLPKLYLSLLVLLIIFLGFPGSFFFIAEFLFFSYLCDLSFLLSSIILFFLFFFIASAYFKNWFISIFHYSFFFTTYKIISDIDLKEFIVFSFFSGLTFILGLLNQFFFSILL